MKKYDLYWLAGILEGEGSFMKGPPSSPRLPIIQMSMTDEDIVAKVANLFGVNYSAISVKRSNDNDWKIPYLVRLRGKKAFDLMEKIKPLMGIRRQEQITKAMSSYSAMYFKLNKDIVRDIKKDLKIGFTQTSISKKFNISRETINRISNNKIWSEVSI
jgi:hypothetical protein